MATKKQVLREQIQAIREGNAAVFAGAGLSRPSGFVVWKELLRPLAEDIGLNIDDEYDLTAVAQYVRNKSGNRAAINSTILDAYSKNVAMNENVSILLWFGADVLSMNLAVCNSVSYSAANILNMFCSPINGIQNSIASFDTNTGIKYSGKDSGGTRTIDRIVIRVDGA